MKKDPLYKSFGYAFQGIFNTIRTERNIKIHCAAAILVTIFGIWLQISKTEWMICFILFAKKAKDAAAGAVLIVAIFAAVIGILIFIPKLLDVAGL